MRLFVTGGTGFIGKNIVEQLGGKYEVIAPTHKELELLNEDAVKDYFDSYEIDIVIHSAVRPGHRNAKDPTKQLYNNVRMFFNLARNPNRFKKMIFFNSGLVYDLGHYQPKMKEEYFDAHVPQDEGGFSKYVCAKYIEQAENIIELRPFGVFGKYEDYTIRFISNIICKAIFDLPLTIRQNRRFDYIYTDDLMPVLEYFIHNDSKHKAYNVTPDQSVELYTLAEIVRKTSRKDLPIVVAQPGMGVEYSGDNSRLREEIKNLRLTDIDEAIRELYEWYSANRQQINREFLLVDK